MHVISGRGDEVHERWILSDHRDAIAAERFTDDVVYVQKSSAELKERGCAAGVTGLYFMV